MGNRYWGKPYTLLKVESYRKGIVQSTLFNVINKGFVFLNSLAIAFYFGTQLKVDLYFYSYNTVLLLVTFINSLNSSVLIPESMRIRKNEDPGKVISFFNFFIYLYLTLTSLICFLFLLNPVNAFTCISNYDPAILRQEASILFLSVPLILLVTLTTMLTDILASYRFFTIPMIAGIINSIFSLLFIICFHKILDVRSISLGLLTSYTVNIIFLFVLLKKHVHWHFQFAWLSLGKKTWGNVAFAQIGNFVTTLGGYAPLYFLSGFGTGVIAALNYAQQISTQPTSFITNQVAAVSRIKMSELYVSSHFDQVNEIFLTTIKFLVFVLFPISGVVYLFADDIVIVLFKRGSFDASSVKMSSDMLRYLALSLPFTAIISIVGNLYAAAQRIRVSIGYQILSNLLLISLVFFSLKWFGYVGYPIAFLGINALNVLVVYIFCRLYFQFIQYDLVLKYLLMMIVANALIIFGLKILFMAIPHQGPWTNLIIGGTLYLALMMGLNTAFNLNKDFSHYLSNFRQKLIGRKN
jgi:peptidoglycan biosynthesis protein MviN/MurJ (putative lipid II flippase)